MNHAISAVIPAYNSAATIVEALDSVLAQTVQVDQIIVVDDGSSDVTPAVVRERYPGVRLIRQANGGPAAARNRGVAEATGEWIAFLDADDVWLPGRLERELACVADHADAIMCCAGRRGVEEHTAGERGATGDTCREIGLEELARHNPIVTSTVLLKRAAFHSAGGFDERFRGPEDYDLWIRVAASGRILALAEPLAGYRHRPGSLSLDERRFLPQVLRVLDKAFGPAGALQGLQDWRNAALATQYQQASWMAFSRGARLTAVRYLAVAWARNCRGPRRVAKAWPALLYRYLLGRPVKGEAQT